MQTSPVVEAIYADYEQRLNGEPPRTYLGASVIGRQCERALWYGFRWVSAPKAFEGRMLRLFETGHLAEQRFADDLRRIGCEVHLHDPATGKQFGFASLGGHMRGHMDAAIFMVPGGGKKWHVGEFKTHNAKSFAELKKLDVEKAKPEHYAQAQWYMGKSGMERGLYVAVNKDTDELYAERIRFDRVLFEQLEARAERIIFAAEPPAKIATDPSWYQCKFCDHHAVCHMERAPQASCRTCVHATPERSGDGDWSCAAAGDRRVIPINIQRAGCPLQLPLPFLLTFAQAEDAGAQWIRFKRRDNGAEFIVMNERVGSVPDPDVPCYTSREVAACADHRAIGDRQLAAMRDAFDGRVVG